MSEDLQNVTGWQWTPKKEKAILLLSDGMDKTKAAAEVGVTRQTLHTWLRAPEFQARLEEVYEEIVGDARRILQRNATAAAKKIVDLLPYGMPGHSTQLAAAKEILDRVGLKSPERLEHSGPDGGPIEIKGYVNVSPDDWDKRG